MSFLLRRTKRALAGWYDDFNRPNENPVMPPWQFWGTAADFALVDNKLRLAAEGQTRTGNYDGGVAYEHQPLTENWAVEFTRAPIGTTSTRSVNETRQQIFLDQNWTEGGDAASTLYQVIIELRSEYEEERRNSDGDVTRTEKMNRAIRIMTRDKVNTGSVWGFTILGSIGGDVDSFGAAEWAGALRVRINVFADRYMVVYVNDAQSLFIDLYDPNFRFGPRKRSANFAQVQGLVASIDDFKTYDLTYNPFRSAWTEVFYDSFDRANNTAVANGWTQTAGNNFGIYEFGLSMNSLFAGSDGFRQIRRDTGSTDMEVEFVLGGDGIGEPNNTAKSAVMGRMAADGRSGLIVYIAEQVMWLGGFAWGGTLTAPTLLPNAPIFISLGGTRLAEGVRYRFSISGDYMWLTNVDLGRVIDLRSGVNAIQPPTPGNTWAGAFISRYSFVNSVPIGELRIRI